MSSHQAYTTKLIELKKAFVEADLQQAGKLTEESFKKFVEIGFKKPCPNGMYSYLCQHFSVNASDGLSWENALQIWKESNHPPKGYVEPTNLDSDSNNTPNSKSGNQLNAINNSNNSHSRSTSPGPNNTDSKSRGARSQRDVNKPMMSPRDQAHRQPSYMRSSTVHSGMLGRHGKADSGSFDNEISDNVSEHSVTGSRSGTGNTNRASVFNRRQPSMNLGLSRRDSSMHDVTNDASSMVVQMLETKLKSVQQQLKDKSKKLKKAEDTTQQLLKTNEKYKQQLNEIESKCKKLERDIKISHDKERKYKTQIEDDRNVITSLKTQEGTISKERDEAFRILTRVEKQSALQISKLKQKHRDDMEKLSNGFLQSLGVDPSSGKDVREVIKELKQENGELNSQVGILSETLSRKEQSLIHALKVLDEVSETNFRAGMVMREYEQKEISDQNDQNDSNNNSNNKNGPKLSKRASIVVTNVMNGLNKRSNHSKNEELRNLNINTNDNDTPTKSKSPLPAPPVRRKFSNPKPMHNADFFRHASSPRAHFINSTNNQVTRNNKFQFNNNSNSNSNNASNNGKNGPKTQVKSMEMLNNALMTDVVDKQDAIDELAVANNSLVDQVMNLQTQLDDMKRNSQIFADKNNINYSKNDGNNNSNKNINNDTKNKTNTKGDAGMTSIQEENVNGSNINENDNNRKLTNVSNASDHTSDTQAGADDTQDLP